MAALLAAQDNGEAQLALACTGCHGANGVSIGNIPPLAARPADELERLLLGFKDGSLQGTIMNHLVQGYDTAQLRAFAKYFSEQPAHVQP
jgi:cytochrome c553